MSEIVNSNDKKDRKNVNVSLRKRDKYILNNILDAWVEEGCNISNEVCDAILLKNLSNTNPHIQTILSTLSLIESSLKAHSITRNLGNEEISEKALEIFNEVITIDIDGNKLTNLIKGVGIHASEIKSSKAEYKDASLNKQSRIDVETENIKEKPVEKVTVTTENDIQSLNNKKEVLKVEKKVQESQKIEKVEELKDEVEEVDDLIFNQFASNPGFSI